jgi:hypothetical protein
MFEASRLELTGSPSDSVSARVARVAGFGSRAFSICLLLLTGLLLTPGLAAQDFRSRLKGLVFETEDWSEPKDAWVKDKFLADKWCLWTTEENVIQKRSGGQSLKSPEVKADRATPAEGATPLHTRITGIPAGLYQVWMNNPIRSIALSFDGQAWTKITPPSGEIDLGLRQIVDGSFELWVDDRYASPENAGSCYYDYLRFEPLAAIEFSRMTAFTLADGQTQLTWVTNRPLPTGTVAFGPGEARTQSVASEAKGRRNHAVVLSALESGRAYSAQVQVGGQTGAQIVSPVLRFSAGARPVPPRSKAQRIPLSVAEPTAAGRRVWPVTSGVPFAQGELASAADVRLFDAAGLGVPLQREVLARWPDGSVRWLLLDFQTATRTEAPSALTLEVRPGDPARRRASPCSARTPTASPSTRAPCAWNSAGRALPCSIASSRTATATAGTRPRSWSRVRPCWAMPGSMTRPASASLLASRTCWRSRQTGRSAPRCGSRATSWPPTAPGSSATGPASPSGAASAWSGCSGRSGTTAARTSSPRSRRRASACRSPPRTV